MKYGDSQKLDSFEREGVGGQPARFMPQWTVPDRLLSTETMLAVFDEIERLYRKRSPKISLYYEDKKPLAYQLARRGLEVAILCARMRQGEDVGAFIEDWTSLHDLSSRSHGSLLRLLNWLGGGSFSPSMRLYRGVKTSKAFGSESEVYDAIEKLVATEGLLRRMREAAGDQSKKLRMSRQHEGDPAARAFAKEIGRTWVALTESSPSASPDADRNPFLRFLMAAWGDAGGEIRGADGDGGTAFVRLARFARDSFPPEVVQAMDPTVRTRPDWF